MTIFINKPIENKKNNNSFKLFTIIILIIAFLVYIVSYLSYSSFKSEKITENSKKVTINMWDTFQNLDKKFPKLDSFWYKIYLKNNMPDYELQAWDYMVKDWLKVESFLESFRYPIIEEDEITLLEGWNIFDYDLYLTQKWLISEWEYISYVENKEKIEKLTDFFPFLKWLDTLEWYLYPDTYKIDKSNFKINNFVIKQLENFENKVYKNILWELSNSEVEKLIKLASIVEKEEKIEANKPIVAWILKKRLVSDWMIWADITVCYPYRLTSEECKMVVSKYINEENDYNTRTKYWLPKTPIWNPSLSTIKATLNYKESPYWFYLHDKSGQIHYWKTNEEHIQNKNSYLR